MMIISTLVLFNQNCSIAFKLVTKIIIKLPAFSCTLFKHQKCLDRPSYILNPCIYDFSLSTHKSKRSEKGIRTCWINDRNLWLKINRSNNITTRSLCFVKYLKISQTLKCNDLILITTIKTSLSSCNQ